MNEPHLKLEFFFDKNNIRMDRYGSGGQLSTSIGNPIRNTQGGPGGMSSDLMGGIYKAVRIFTQKRNFRPGSVVMPLKGGIKRTLKKIDYDAGTAKTRSGKHIILSQMTTVEW